MPRKKSVSLRMAKLAMAPAKRAPSTQGRQVRIAIRRSKGKF